MNTPSFSYSDIFENKNRVLVVTAHPDDSVVFFGALMHRLHSEGKEVFVLVVTNGARGSKENEISESDLAKTRLAEESDALSALGIPRENLFCLGYLDGEVESDMYLIGEIAYYIRKLKVDLVCTHEPFHQYLPTYNRQGYFVQHRDHRHVGEAAIDAVYPFSRDRSFFPEHYAKGVEPHSVFDILVTDEKACNFEFECTLQREAKKQALIAHKSQFPPDVAERILNAHTFDGKLLERFQYIHLLW